MAFTPRCTWAPCAGVPAAWMSIRMIPFTPKAISCSLRCEAAGGLALERAGAEGGASNSVWMYQAYFFPRNRESGGSGSGCAGSGVGRMRAFTFRYMFL